MCVTLLKQKSQNLENNDNVCIIEEIAMDWTMLPLNRLKIKSYSLGWNCFGTGYLKRKLYLNSLEQSLSKPLSLGNRAQAFTENRAHKDTRKNR